MTSIAILLALAIGVAAGYFYRDVRDKIAELRKIVDENKKPVAPTITMGSYDKVDVPNHVNTESVVGISEPKTPQLLAWEEEERLKREVERG